MSDPEGSEDRPWIFCQLGAREHYVLPRAFHHAGRLRALITEAWVRPGSLSARAPGQVGRRFQFRYAADLADAPVEDFTNAAIAFELGLRLQRRSPNHWPAIMARNQWFERQAVDRLRRKRLLDGPVKPVVFAYSYAALGILRAAKAAGCTTVLGQIDPGITEENIVADAVLRHAALKPDWERAPASYWARWRMECDIADRIVVNSTWSKQGLIQSGVDAAKLSIVPLAYTENAAPPQRRFPPRFSNERPLRVLFLGSLVVRKGIAELIEATRILACEPVEFHLVGPEAIEIPAEVRANPRVFCHGPAVRGEVAGHYAAADLFILPSLSDGFGLTQIEAHAKGLPVIASRYCGDVVTDGVDGRLLDEVSGGAIAGVIRQYLDDPEALASHAAGAPASADRFAPTGDQLIRALDEVAG